MEFYQGKKWTAMFFPKKLKVMSYILKCSINWKIWPASFCVFITTYLRSIMTHVETKDPVAYYFSYSQAKNRLDWPFNLEYDSLLQKLKKKNWKILLTCSSKDIALGCNFSNTKCDTCLAQATFMFGIWLQSSLKICLDTTRLTFSWTTAKHKRKRYS